MSAYYRSKMATIISRHIDSARRLWPRATADECPTVFSTFIGWGFVVFSAIVATAVHAPAPRHTYSGG